MGEDLTHLSVAELDALIKTAKDVREQTRERRRQELKAEIEAKLKQEGFLASEVLGTKLKLKAEPLPAKYTDPDEPALTWSGRGRMPGWLQGRVDKGEPLERFLIG